MTIQRIRASSWGKLFDCAYAWEGINLLGLRSVSGPRAAMGSAIHAGTAAFDLARLQHAPITPDAAAGALVDYLDEHKDSIDWRKDDLSRREVERIGLTLHTMYCVQWSPRFDFVSVEMETAPFQINCGNGITVELVGTLDRCRVRTLAGTHAVGINDIKTGGAAVANGVAKTKGHSAQIGTYELLHEHTTGQRPTLPGGIIGMKTNGRPEIAEGAILNARAVMVGDGQHPGLIEFAAEMLRTGLFPPNPQSMTCHPVYCPRWSSCPYHE